MFLPVATVISYTVNRYWDVLRMLSCQIYLKPILDFKEIYEKEIDKENTHE